MDTLFSVRGKVAVVTGGGRGIGLMITRGLLEHGVRVYVASRKRDVLDAIVEQLAPLGNVQAVAADLATVAGAETVATFLAEREDKLDILVNNAGAIWQEPIDAHSERGWDRVLDLNLKGVFFVTQKLLPLLRAAGTADAPARIVNIGSVSGLSIQPRDTFAYGASKAGLHYLTRSLASELAADHIRVNAIAPGPFLTDMVTPAVRAGADLTATVPLGRLGEAEDIVGAVVYLCSRASAYITGAVIPLDGGETTTQ